MLKQEQFVQLYCVYLFSHKHLSQNNLFFEQYKKLKKEIFNVLTQCFKKVYNYLVASRKLGTG